MIDNGHRWPFVNQVDLVVADPGDGRRGGGLYFILSIVMFMRTIVNLMIPCLLGKLRNVILSDYLHCGDDDGINLNGYMKSAKLPACT